MAKGLVLLRFEQEEVGSGCDSKEIIVPIMINGDRCSGMPISYIGNDIKMIKELADIAYKNGEDRGGTLRRYGVSIDDYPKTWSKRIEYIVKQYGKSQGLYTVMEYNDTDPTVIS